MPSPIRLAVLGAGIFARNVHIPALLALRDQFEIVAIYSRTLDNAKALVAQCAEGGVSGIDATDDLDRVIARSDIDAVNVILPIPMLPDMVTRALRAGKHVISEKPIATDIPTGQRLLDLYTQHPDQVWMVAENYRYESAFAEARKTVQQVISHRMPVCQMTWYVGFPGDQNPYFATRWRRENVWPGGSMYDGGVHYVATMRTVVGEIDTVTAFMAHRHSDLPPMDTLSAALRFDNGAIGTLLVTFTHSSPWDNALHVSSETGALRVSPTLLEVTTGGFTHTQEFKRDGVRNELAAFAASIQEGAPHRNTPDQALQDVAVIAALLESAETGHPVKVARFVAPPGA